MLVQTRIALLILVSFLLYINVVQSRRGGGSRGGGSSRGSSSSRNFGSSSSSSRGSSGSSGSRGGGVSKFVSGTGVGSIASSNNFKSAITGAAAGYLTYRAGQAVINMANLPMNWNGRAYYWGSSYYPRYFDFDMCSMPLNASDPAFKDVVFKDGARPTQIVWGCKAYEENCCGMECCKQSNFSNPSTIAIILGVIAVLLTVTCCCCCCCCCCGRINNADLDEAKPDGSITRVIPVSDERNGFHANNQGKREMIVFLTNAKAPS
uniref:CX domain-containing protein n=1 Tax=Plectus sambesii TaxID=2011161 RepID=A0A914VMK5_9BILA